MKKIVLSFAALLPALPAAACLSCDRRIREGILNGSFYPRMLVMLAVLAALLLAITAALAATAGRFRKHNRPPEMRLRLRLVAAVLLLGAGLGGLVDSIALHQILQFHEMFSAGTPATDYVGKSVNMFWDGIFNFCCFLAILAGTILLWQVAAARQDVFAAKIFSGGLLAGWGIFNFAEGLVDHVIFGVHHVVQRLGFSVYDCFFLASGLLFAWAGMALVWKGLEKKGYHSVPEKYV